MTFEEEQAKLGVTPDSLDGKLTLTMGGPFTVDTTLPIIANHLRDMGARPERIVCMSRGFMGSDGFPDDGATDRCGVDYGTDEDGDDYAIVGHCLNPFSCKNVYAEIDDGTYGTLQGWRIYLGTQDGEGLPPTESGPTHTVPLTPLSDLDAAVQAADTLSPEALADAAEESRKLNEEDV